MRTLGADTLTLWLVSILHMRELPLPEVGRGHAYQRTLKYNNGNYRFKLFPVYQTYLFRMLRSSYIQLFSEIRIERSMQSLLTWKV